MRKKAHKLTILHRQVRMTNPAWLASSIRLFQEAPPMQGTQIEQLWCTFGLTNHRLSKQCRSGQEKCHQKRPAGTRVYRIHSRWWIGCYFPSPRPSGYRGWDSPFRGCSGICDGGSSVNIIFCFNFRRLGIREKLLDQCCPALIAFGGGHMQPLGHMPLTLSIGTHPRGANITTNFTITEYPSSYNVILNCSAIINLDLSINMRALVIKFPTSWGVDSVRGNQGSAWTC